MGHRIVHDGPIGPGFGVASDYCQTYLRWCFARKLFAMNIKGADIIRAILRKLVLDRIILLSDFEFMRYAALVIRKKDKRWLGD